MATSWSRFRTMSLPFCERSFDVSWTENSKTPSNASSDSAILLILLCSECRIMHEGHWNFWCHILIDGLITNQITLMLSIRWGTKFGKMFGIDCMQAILFIPTPFVFSLTPPHFSPIFSHSRSAPPLFDLRLEKVRKQLLGRLVFSRHTIPVWLQFLRVWKVQWRTLWPSVVIQVIEGKKTHWVLQGQWKSCITHPNSRIHFM